MFEFLKRIPLFAAMPDEDFQRLCGMVKKEELKAGDELFAEGSKGDRAYVIMAGEVEIVKKSGNRELLLAIRPAGEVIGEMALLEEAPRMATVRAHTDATLLAIHHDELDKLLNSSPSAARAMLTTMVARLRNTEATMRESERMAQLGTLSAGVAHELNNPAAAVQRGAGQLEEAVNRLGQRREQLWNMHLSAEQRDRVRALEQLAQTPDNAARHFDALQRSDLEYELEEWLGANGVSDAWELTPTLVELGIKPDRLQDLRTTLQDAFAPALSLVVAQRAVDSLLHEVTDGASRIAGIVKALKSYSYLDQAPVQNVDVREGLDNTLIILRDKLKGVNVERRYDPQLPAIEAYGSELNQVFTNILDNAADALEEHPDPHIIIQTYQEDSDIVITIEDNGPGIPPEHIHRIFDAFYTTKGPGKGTGLGLNISYNIVTTRHRGDLSVRSSPGSTIFTVSLPISAPIEAKSNAHVDVDIPDDATLRRILEETRTIAVVGMSNKPNRRAHTVPLYLHLEGYEILPVNPRGGWMDGLRVFPDLLSLPKVPDVVLIFRPSDEVPPIVEQAIQIAARVIWMESGVRHEDAAAQARNAGLDVVMDTCIRNTHKRLLA